MPPNLEAVVPTTEVAAAAADEVSSALAELFTANARAYHAVSAQAAQFHQEFVRALSAGASAYAAAEAANADPLQLLLSAINAPTQTWLGRPLVGNGADGAPGRNGDMAACCSAMAVAAVTPPPLTGLRAMVATPD